MNRVFLFFMFLILVTLPVSAEVIEDTSETSSPRIEDELIKSKHFHKKIKPVSVKNNMPITDELVEHKMDRNSVFKLEVFKHGKYEDKTIQDELIDKDFVNNASGKIITKKEIPDDYFIERRIDTSKVRFIKAKTKYDFTKKQIPVHIRISKHLNSKNGSLEGDTIPFETTKDFEINGKKFKKGTPVFGRIETISDSDKMGVPECIKIDNFYIQDEQEIDLHGSISKTGSNRSIWVYPLYQAGNICFYVAGFVFVPIHGGRAKFSTEETFTVFYETK